MSRNTIAHTLHTITKRFLMKEDYSPSAVSPLQALKDIVEHLKPSSKRDYNRLQLAKEQLSKLRKHFRKMEEKITHLEEQLQLLEENKESQ